MLDPNVVTLVFNTEKSFFLRDNFHTIVVAVKKNARKESIKSSVESSLGVKVLDVRTSNFRRTPLMFKGRRSEVKILKKAYIKISKESNFDINKLYK